MAQFDSAYLIVEDDKATAEMVAKMLAPFGRPKVAGSVREAMKVHASEERWAAYYVDVVLPDGDGFDFIEGVRREGPRVPTLVMTAHVVPESANLAYDYHVDFIFKPLTMTRIVQHAMHGTVALARQPRNYDEGDVELRSVMREWQAVSDITATETEILRMTVRGYPRDEIAKRLGIKEGTLKKHAHNLLQKTGDKTLERSGLRAMWEAMDRLHLVNRHELKSKLPPGGKMPPP